MQLSGTVLRLIEQVLREAERKPADGVLRTLLRTPEIRPDQKELISRAVFAYFRWRGWLNPKIAIRGQLEQVFDLAERLVKKPESFTGEELLSRALPAWAAEAMQLSPATARQFQSEPRLWLRARPGRAQDLAIKLGEAEAHEHIPDAVWYRGVEDLFRTPEFHGGEFEIQDLSSQIVGHLCAPKPGETWWDACAGEGGKLLHLCDLMQNKGLVWASDTAQWRLDLLKRRASRAKLFNYRIKVWPSLEHLPTKTKFDGILVDAPCSGLGTWGRNPHARWSAQPSDVAKLAELQLKLLRKVTGALKPGGRLIYSVCTLTRAETEEVARAFEAAHPEFQPLEFAVPGSALKPVARLRLLPEEWKAAGMFIAGWKKI